MADYGKTLKDMKNNVMDDVIIPFSVPFLMINTMIYYLPSSPKIAEVSGKDYVQQMISRAELSYTGNVFYTLGVCGGLAGALIQIATMRDHPELIWLPAATNLCSLVDEIIDYNRKQAPLKAD
jgi:hypothetical protein